MMREEIILILKIKIFSSKKRVLSLFFIVKILLLLPLLLGFSVPAIAHNEANGGCGRECVEGEVSDSGEGEEDGIGVDSSITHLVK